MCVEANIELAPDVTKAISRAEDTEQSADGRWALEILAKNLEIARTDRCPICQDTGMAVIFLDIGQDVHITGGDLYAAVNAGVSKGYRDGYLRKSVVTDPLDRVNTGDNTPAVIHCQIVPGDAVSITVAPKGFGSENKSRLAMLTVSDGEQGIRDFVLDTVRSAGANACPPMVVGVGIGGDFELCAELAKRALIRPLSAHHALPRYAAMERELLEEINSTGIGPAGLGGNVTALAVHIETYPTHIAGLPVAVNICCHVDRHVTRTI